MEYKTAQGTRIPALGFGTYLLEKPDARRMVEAALEIGYRHIDTAPVYENETETGAAIAASGIARDDVFLTTKIWIDDFKADDLEAAADASLERLATDYVDLLLLHWPNPDVPFEETLCALARVRQSGKARHIGLSNHTAALVQQAVDILGADTLINNQVEYHPFLSQQTLCEQAQQLDMLITAYCPLAQGKVMGEPILHKIGAKYGKTEAQVTLRWLLQQERVLAIPRTKSEAHARANFDVFDFKLDETDRAQIDTLQGNGRLNEPPKGSLTWDRP